MSVAGEEFIWKFQKNSAGRQPVLIFPKSREKFARKRGIFICETFAEARQKCGTSSFEVVTLWEVIEHALNPRELLSEVPPESAIRAFD